MTGGHSTKQNSTQQGGSNKSTSGTSGATSCHDAPESVWVFGYGSLLWKTNFPYEDKVVGCVKGYARRFWQGSTDHRGVPGAPGRVVTLIEMKEESTWGLAYRVHPEHVPEVMAYLDHREKGGYTTHEVTFHPQTKGVSSFTVLVYIGTELNPNYLGPAPLDAIAKQVMNSRGPSGCNTEYMLNLATSMREIAPSVSDEHLYSLESKVREMIETKLRTRSGQVTTLPEHCLCNCCDLTAVAKETKQVSQTQDKEHEN